jgi:DNA processing protein
MKFTDNALNVLVAMTYKGIGRAWIVQNIKGNESTDRMVALLNQTTKENRLISTYEFDEKKRAISTKLKQLEGFVHGVVAIADSDFPPYRGVVKNSEKPVALFYSGDLSLLKRNNKNIAVIGLLNPDKDIESFEQQVVSMLLNYDVTIVSGLALGCDSIAHKESLRSNGKTIGILPSPITDILPKANTELAKEIVKNNGLLISEYYEKANSKAELSKRYIERDRLQALFSDCVILSASYAENNLGNDSGARHAMNYALSYSICRAVMYESKLSDDNPKYDLNRQLLREDSRIIVISRDNLQEAIEKIIVSVELAHSSKNWMQKDLFGQENV